MEDRPELPVAGEWFAVRPVTGRTAMLTEPHVDPLLRANVWYLRGRDRDLVLDSGNGVGELGRALARLAHGRRRELVCLATHAHVDHIGGFHEFSRRLLHPAEEPVAAFAFSIAPLHPPSWPQEAYDEIADGGFVPAPLLVDATPYPGFDPEAFRITPAAPTHAVREGDELELGGRRLTVLELPGHTPGSVGLVDHEERALLSGDAVYDGGLIDTLAESDRDAYARTMERLLRLDVDVVYPGHGEPFGRRRLRELAAAYLGDRDG